MEESVRNTLVPVTEFTPSENPIGASRFPWIYINVSFLNRRIYTCSLHESNRRVSLLTKSFFWPGPAFPAGQT